MQKKVIKRKTNTGKSSGTSTKKVTKLKLNNNIKFVILLIVIAAIIVSYVTLGLIGAAIATIGIGFIGLMWYLLFGGKNNKKKKKKIISVLIIIFLLLGIAGMLAFSAFIVYVKVQADPKFETTNLNTLEISRIYDKDGNEIAKLGSEKREKVKYEELPEILIDAIIATEDSRFFQHNGLDAPRFLKAMIGQVTKGSEAGGASTLSMQVVKNSFTSTEARGIQGIIRKFEGIYLAVFKLEKKYSKQEIIEFYVNNHFLGGNIYGVEEAANAYFGKSVGELNLSEAAIIAGMFKSPNAYRPTTNPENAAKRRSTVLYLMRKAGYITKEEADIANSIPVESLTAEVNYSNENPYQGYIDTVVEEIQNRYGVNPYTTPLLVYTNLDRGRQDAVNSVLNGQNYDWINDRIQCGVAVIDTHTGKIIAIGNGRNINSRNNSTAAQFNYATQIKRQPGSTAKPLFDYGPGIEYNNWSTYEQFNDAPYSYSNGRSIKNWDGGYYGQITLRKTLSTSRNIPALKAFQSVDNAKIIEFVTGLGIKPEIENGRIHEAHSIGAFTGVSPVQMAAAYAAFSNGGYYNEPYSVSKIVFRQTGETQEFHQESKQVMSDATAFMISSVLQDVALTGGTPYNVACKTGTTNYDDVTMSRYNMPYDAVRDSWVVGFSTQTAIGMWYGYDGFTKESVAEGYIMHNIPATIQKDRLFSSLVNSGAMEGDRAAFAQPSSVVKIGIAPGSNPPKLAVPGGGAVYEYFKKGTEPTEYDTSSYKIGAPGNFKATEKNGKVTLSWNPVSPGELGDDSHGAFGYNIYKDNVLIEWTSKTSYTFTPSNPYGTYKVIATYKSYNDLQSEAATAKIEKPEEKPAETEEPVTPVEPTTPPTEPTTPDPNEQQNNSNTQPKTNP